MERYLSGPTPDAGPAPQAGQAAAVRLQQALRQWRPCSSSVSLRRHTADALVAVSGPVQTRVTDLPTFLWLKKVYLCDHVFRWRPSLIFRCMSQVVCYGANKPNKVARLGQKSRRTQ